MTTQNSQNSSLRDLLRQVKVAAVEWEIEKLSPNTRSYVSIRSKNGYIAFYGLSLSEAAVIVKEHNTTVSLLLAVTKGLEESTARLLELSGPRSDCLAYSTVKSITQKLSAALNQEKK
jgi:hypothetical protein